MAQAGGGEGEVIGHEHDLLLMLFVPDDDAAQQEFETVALRPLAVEANGLVGADGAVVGHRSGLDDFENHVMERPGDEEDPASVHRAKRRNRRNRDHGHDGTFGKASECAIRTSGTRAGVINT